MCLRSVITCKLILPKKTLQYFVIRLFSFFWTFKCCVLFEVIRLLKLVSLLSKSVLFTKSACFNLDAKLSAVNLWNSWVVIYLELSGILFSTWLVLYSKQF